MQANQFITRTKNAVTALLNAADELRAVDYEYVQSGISATVTDADCQPFGITKQNLLDIVSSIEAINSLLAAGHSTNLIRLK